MTFAPIPSLIQTLQEGRMVILVDDPSRENEGDLVMAGSMVTAGAINFMLRHGRGLVCMPIRRSLAQHLGIEPMVHTNMAQHTTPFAVSIGAREGITTGVSAYDRAHTIRLAADPTCEKENLVSPGHVFPLLAHPEGVLKRAGHTEGAIDLMDLAGLFPVAVVCEILNEDGSLARLPQLRAFALEHKLLMGSIAELISLRRQMVLQDQVPQREEALV